MSPVPALSFSCKMWPLPAALTVMLVVKACVLLSGLKPSTLGFQAGGGVDIGSITADLRYEGGLTKINDSYGQRQNLWALSIGFKFF